MENLFAGLALLYSTEGLAQVVLGVGVWVLIAIVFAETGLLLGFFLPGDSLLVATGALVASVERGDLPASPGFELGFLMFSLTVAAIVGDQVGYWLGRKTGPAIFSRDEGVFFKRRYAIEAHEFYLKHGGKAVVIARFIPIMRTFVPFIAGVADMPYRNFVFYNLLGGILWVPSLLLLGYVLGHTPLAQQLHHIILLVVALSLLPMVYAFYQRWRRA